MTPGERALRERVEAGLRELSVTHFNLAVTAGDAAGSIGNFVQAFESSVERELATHPDISEVNVMCDGFYGSEEES